jgi:hypothetical protein
MLGILTCSVLVYVGDEQGELVGVLLHVATGKTRRAEVANVAVLDEYRQMVRLRITFCMLMFTRGVEISPPSVM